MSEKIFDVAIIGSGPAGYSASIYASRYNMSNVVFGRLPGGTMSEAHKICNFPAFEETTGFELGEKMFNHAKSFGAEMAMKSAEAIKKEGDIFKIYTDSKEEYLAKTIILATGTKRRQLSIPGEDKYLGKGISYCATCDANFFRNKTVAVVGGNNAATTASLLLSEVAEKVYLIYRGDKLKGDQKWVEDVMKHHKIEVIFNMLVTGVDGGDSHLEKIMLNREYNGVKELNVDGLFIEIGADPNADLPRKLGLDIDEEGYIKVKEDQSTSIDGIWAAGDMTTNSNKFQQIVTAVAEGAVAANSAYKYIMSKN